MLHESDAGEYSVLSTYEPAYVYTEYKNGTNIADLFYGVTTMAIVEVRADG